METITQQTLTHEEALAIVEPFYNLFRAEKRDWDKAWLALDDNWKAYYTNSAYRTKEDTRPYLQGLFDIVPDINVEIRQIIVDGDTIAVRSELSGTPVKDFMVPYSGRSFSIMTIDINHVKNGKIIALYHAEDWGTAIKQLSGQE
jgi:predicted ester cyclase